MSQIGRIGGQVLTDNLLRAGVDLAFETDLLYLDVTNRRIGIKDSTPSYDLDINNNLRTTDLTIDTQAAIQNLRLNSPETISTSVGGIDVYINGGGELFHDRLATRTGSTNYLLFDGNRITSFSNNNIVFDPNGSGEVLVGADTNVTGDVSVSGNTIMSGDLSSAGTIIVGDQTLDTVTVNTDFTQSIIPGEDLTYALGADAADSSPRRWAEIYAPDWTPINSGAWAGSGLRPQSITVSEQMTLDGVNNKISAIQSNEDIALLPDTGISYIENTKWENSDITNLLNTPLTFGSTGIGYTRIMGDNAMIVPSGTDSERRGSPEVGETRWNTDQGYLECFDGSIWQVSIGSGPTVTSADMDDLSNIYTLILG
jgi:hypothetical protein